MPALRSSKAKDVGAIAVNGAPAQPKFTTAIQRATCLRNTLTKVCLLSALMAMKMSAQFCVAGTPSNEVDDTMTVAKTPAGNYFDNRTSAGTAYNKGCNSHFTVDIFLPGTYNAPGIGSNITIDPGFASWWLITQSSCPSAVESVVIYRSVQLSGGAWSAWGPAVQHYYAPGHWVPSPDIGGSPHCAFSVPFQAKAIPGVLQRFRVMVLPTLYGAPMPATVWWEWSL